jgi:hypothetical protein
MGNIRDGEPKLELVIAVEDKGLPLIDKKGNPRWRCTGAIN